MEPIQPDEQMCADIRLGIAVRQAFQSKWYRRKDGKGVWWSFSWTLIDAAGGFRRFLDEWEEVSE